MDGNEAYSVQIIQFNKLTTTSLLVIAIIKAVQHIIWWKIGGLPIFCIATCGSFSNYGTVFAILAYSGFTCIEFTF